MLQDGSWIFKPEGHHEAFSDLIKYAWMLERWQGTVRLRRMERILFGECANCVTEARITCTLQYTYMHMDSLLQRKMTEDLFKRPLTKTTSNHQHGCIDGRQVSRGKVCWVGGGRDLGALCYMEGSAEPKLMWGLLKMKIPTRDKREGGCRRGGKNGGPGRKIDLSGGWEEKKGWLDGGRVRGRWKWLRWNKLKMNVCCCVADVGATVTS